MDQHEVPLMSTDDVEHEVKRILTEEPRSLLIAAARHIHERKAVLAKIWKEAKSADNSTIFYMASTRYRNEADQTSGAQTMLTKLVLSELFNNDDSLMAITNACSVAARLVHLVGQDEGEGR